MPPSAPTMQWVQQPVYGPDARLYDDGADGGAQRAERSALPKRKRSAARLRVPWWEEFSSDAHGVEMRRL